MELSTKGRPLTLRTLPVYSDLVLQAQDNLGNWVTITNIAGGAKLHVHQTDTYWLKQFWGAINAMQDREAADAATQSALSPTLTPKEPT